MSDDLDPEERLRRSILIRRTILGVGGVAFGLASLTMGVVALVLTFRGHLGGRGMIRMSFLFLALGVIFAAAGARTLWVGETDPVTGKLVAGQLPVPWPVVAGASLAVTLVVSAIAAWPLGLYQWLGTLDSGCRLVLQADELSRLGGRAIVLGDVIDQSDDLHCSATFVDERGARVATVEIGGDLGGGQFENHLRFLARGATRDPIPGLGDEAHRLRSSGGSAIAVRSGHAGLFVQLTPAFDDEAVSSAIEAVRARLVVMEPYAARWTERYGAR